MLSNLDALWKLLPYWAQFVGGVIIISVGISLIKALYQRKRWKERIEGLVVFGSVLLINRIWGISGLLIAFGSVGGVVLWEVISRSDKAEAKRRRRMLRAIQGYLRAHYDRFHGPLRQDKQRGWMDYEEFLKKEYGVIGEWLLLDKYDEEGFTAEDFDAMARREREEAERAAEKEKAASKPDSEP